MKDINKSFDEKKPNIAWQDPLQPALENWF
jgi:hypothetical protein